MVQCSASATALVTAAWLHRPSMAKVNLQPVIVRSRGCWASNSNGLHWFMLDDRQCILHVEAFIIYLICFGVYATTPICSTIWWGYAIREGYCVNIIGYVDFSTVNNENIVGPTTSHTQWLTRNGGYRPFSTGGLSLRLPHYQSSPLNVCVCM